MNRVLRTVFLALCALVLLQPAIGQLAVMVSFGPPALPIYELPPCPGDGYLWTPGYWAWDPGFGYYWVPGTWVTAPEPGLLWTPGWWGWEGSGFRFHEGYWAPEVGFYGGINYDHGYYGRGFDGGRWDGRVFRYNTAVLDVNTSVVHNTYVDRTVIVNNNTINRVSYNGGQGGVTARPTPQEELATQVRHIAPVPTQQQQILAARTDSNLRAAQNQGKPSIAATSRPGEFSGRAVVAAKQAGAPYHAPPADAMGSGNGHPGENAPPRPNENPAPSPRESGRPASREAPPAQPSDRHPYQTAPPNTGNLKPGDQRSQQREQLQQKQEQQNQQRQQLQQKQEQEHQKAQQRNEKEPQMEQRHQQQTQQAEHQHADQTQKQQPKQPPPPKPKEDH